MKEPLELITAAFSPASDSLPATTVPISVDRLTLAKRRWRGVAADGREFGFDLESPLGDGAAVFVTDTTVYRLTQRPETVLEISLGSDPTTAARVGWLLGNLHFRIGVTEAAVLTPDDPAIRQLLDRERIGYHATQAVFRPLAGGHSHSH